MANIPAHMRIRDEVVSARPQAQRLSIAALIVIGAGIGLTLAVLAQLAGVIH